MQWHMWVKDGCRSLNLFVGFIIRLQWHNWNIPKMSSKPLNQSLHLQIARVSCLLVLSWIIKYLVDLDACLWWLCQFHLQALWGSCACGSASRLDRRYLSWYISMKPESGMTCEDAWQRSLQNYVAERNMKTLRRECVKQLRCPTRQLSAPLSLTTSTPPSHPFNRPWTLLCSWFIGTGKSFQIPRSCVPHSGIRTKVYVCM